MTKIFKPERISILGNKNITEKMIQQIIAEDPSIIGLGDIVLKDKERVQPRAGRLDLLMQDAETNRRYEIEVQLGKTDETHIIRTIEYWDIERKRYPQYDHCAVIIAEDITSRFLNVISLFNGFIPVIAIQMNAYQFEDNVGLVFTKVLDEMPLGLVDEDEEVLEITDRDYWLKRASQATVSMANEVLDIINAYKPGFELKYNKFYIGLSKDGQPNNFVIFRPKKNHMVIVFKYPQSEEFENIINDAGLDLMGYDSNWSRYRIRLTKSELTKKTEVLRQLIAKSESHFNS